MRFVEPPSLASLGRGHPGDELDGLLSAFFHARLPRSWPELKLPGTQPTVPLASPRPTRHAATWRGRLALAASIALLLGGVGLLSGKFQEIANPLSRATAPTTADRSEIPHITREHMIVDPSGTKYRINLEGQLKDMLP